MVHKTESELIGFARRYDLPLHTIERVWNDSNSLDEFHIKISDVLEQNRLLD